MGYWDDIIKWGGAAAIGIGTGVATMNPGLGLQAGSASLPVTGALGNWIAPDQPPQLPTRPSIGLEGQSAAQEQARAMQSILNQNLASSTIPMINRQWGGAGRYASGQRLGAIERAAGQSQGILGQQIGANALQVYLAQFGAQEERDWRQAQLDLAGTQQPSAWQGMGKLAPLFLEYFLKSRQGGGQSTTGGGSAGLTQAYAGMG